MQRVAALLAALLLAPLAAGAQPAAAPDAAARAALEKRGRILFLQCVACHAVKAAENAGKVGPHLEGLIGRPAGTLPGFAFSPALKASGITWDAATLERWLAGPSAVVPGTTMVLAGIADPGQRAALVAFLESATRP